MDILIKLLKQTYAVIAYLVILFLDFAALMGHEDDDSEALDIYGNTEYESDAHAEFPHLGPAGALDEVMSIEEGN